MKTDTYHVLIAGPSDVEPEKAAAERAIAEFNSQHAKHMKVVLLPARWEKNTRPATGVRPQAEINRQMVNDCDLAVALFRSRLGTSTGVAVAGTVEEIDTMVESGKPVMIYFSNRSEQPSKINVEQLSNLMDFKKETYANALVLDVADDVALEAQLLRDLLAQVREMQDAPLKEREAPPVASPTPDPENLLFMVEQRDRIRILGDMLRSLEKVSIQARLSIEKTRSIAMNSAHLEPRVANDLMKQRSKAMQEMNFAFSDMLDLAAEYGSFPEDIANRIANLERVIRRIMQNINAFVHNSAHKESNYDHEVNSILHHLQGFIAYVIHEEQRILDPDQKVFRPVPGVVAQCEGLIRWWNPLSSPGG